MISEHDLLTAIAEAVALFEALSVTRRLAVAPVLLAALVAHECSPFQADRESGGVYIDDASWRLLADQIQAALDAASVERAHS